MTVAFSHGTAEWPSFTAFFKFRQHLAAEVGVKLAEMDGFGGTRPWSSIVDPLAAFLAMDDVTGSLGQHELEVVATRLRSIVLGWPDGEPDRERALALVEGLEQAAAVRQRFRFR